MTNVIQFPTTDKDNHGYTMSGDKVTGVYFKLDNGRIVMPLSGAAIIYNKYEGLEITISQDDLKHLMIMWLSMVDPEVINYDADSLK